MAGSVIVRDDPGWHAGTMATTVSGPFPIERSSWCVVACCAQVHEMEASNGLSGVALNPVTGGTGLSSPLTGMCGLSSVAAGASSPGGASAAQLAVAINAAREESWSKDREKLGLITGRFSKRRAAS